MSDDYSTDRYAVVEVQPGRFHIRPRKARQEVTDETHECVFVEEQEPSGRLVLPPCIVCGLTAMDALEQLREGLRDAGVDR